MNRHICFVGASLILSLVVTRTVCQSKPSKSDSDITSIGHRNISQGLNFYSLEHEKELGSKLAEETDKSSKFITDPEISAYVAKVARKIEQNSDKHMAITIKLVDSDEAKSFTLPGSHQYITKGLLVRLQNEGELASAIARGVAHTALRSYTRTATKAEMMQLSTIPGTAGSPAVGIPLVELKGRRDYELAADFFGIQYLYKSGYDTQCFLDFVQLVGNSNKNIPPALSADPPLAQRLQLLQKEIAKILPNRGGAVISTIEFQEFKDRIQALTTDTVPPNR